jgi:peptidoglycan/LPS O-acetylase OafA/YrhL
MAPSRNYRSVSFTAPVKSNWRVIVFGTYRLILALFVLLKHFKGTEVLAGLAVWAFFLLSGFVITGALNTRYQSGRAHLIEFSVNRALRIFPTYWLSVLAAFLCIQAFGHLVDPRSINSALGIPERGLEWISTVLILGGTFFGIGRLETSLSPSSWAIDVEIFMYAASILWLSRTWKGAKLTLIICVAVFPFIYLTSKFLARTGYPEIGNSLIYSFLPVALIPYTLGACVWHLRNKIKKPERPRVHLAIASLGVLLCGTVLSRSSVTLSFLASLPMLAYITWLLSLNKGGPKRVGIDTFFGHMAYPVYLLHWVANHFVLAIAALWGSGTKLAVLDGQGLLQTTVTGFALIVAATLLMSALVAWFFESPIDSRRHKWSSQFTTFLLRPRG